MMISANLIIHPYSSMLNCWQAIAHAELSQLCGLMNPPASLKTRDNLNFFVGWASQCGELCKHDMMMAMMSCIFNL